MTGRVGILSPVEAHRAEIEDAFARRLPATLSILLEGLAVDLEKRGHSHAFILRAASATAWRGGIDEARTLFDSALGAMADSAPGDG